MTAIGGDIKINNSTGSDTAASGWASTATLSGTGASTTASSATVDLSADTPNLSGVVAGDLLWVDSSSGRQFSVIASVDDGLDTVTCDDVFANTESTRNWGIGGKRSTIAGSLALAADAKPGWEIDIEETGTAYTIVGLTQTAGGDATTGPVVWKSTSGTKPAINFAPAASTNEAWTLAASDITLRNLKFDQTNNEVIVRALFGGTAGAVKRIRFEKCEITQASSTQQDNAVNIANNTSEGGCAFIECYLHDVGGIFIDHAQGEHGLVVMRCHFKAGTTGDWLDIHDCRGIVIEDNVFADAAADAINLAQDSHGAVIKGNAIYNSTGDGIQITGGMAPVTIVNNILDSNGGYGINFSTAVADNSVLCDHNAFRNNTSGEMNGVGNGANDITLTADPFVAVASDDYNIANNAGGGAALRAVTVSIPGT